MTMSRCSLAMLAQLKDVCVLVVSLFPSWGGSSPHATSDLEILPEVVIPVEVLGVVGLGLVD